MEEQRAKPERPWKVDETTHQPRGGALMVTFGLLLFLWGGVSMVVYGATGPAFLVGLLGVGLLVGGITVRSVRGAAIRQRVKD